MTFAAVTLAWIFFRAPSIRDALRYIRGMFTQDVISLPDHWNSLVLVAMMFLLDVVNRHHVRDPFAHVPWRGLRYAVYFLMALGVILFSGREDVQFIYFQF
ncbi:MAG: hypothetical protein JNM91_07930 [Flavobacteriales bacterium]|nr:hypothetical protein [Flavobacteriales bacterium]